MSLRDPTKKMSKSDVVEKSRILLTDPPEIIDRRIRQAVTDSQPIVEAYDPIARPGISNLLSILAGMKNQSVEEVTREAYGWTTGRLKMAASAACVETLRPIQEEMARLDRDPGYIDEVLRQGKEAAEAVANPQLHQLHKAIGLR